MNYNTLDKGELVDEFFAWYTSTRKEYPYAIHVNLLYISDWNLFQLENEIQLVEHVYYGENYSEYHTKEYFMNAVRVIREFLHSQT